MLQIEFKAHTFMAKELMGNLKNKIVITFF